MATKSAAAIGISQRDAKYLAEMDECMVELAAIRRDLKKTDAEIRRLEVSTRRKLDHIRTNLHVEKAAQNGNSAAAPARHLPPDFSKKIVGQFGPGPFERPPDGGN